MVAVIACGLGFRQGRGSLAGSISRETRSRAVICLLPQDFRSNALRKPSAPDA